MSLTAYQINVLVIYFREKVEESGIIRFSQSPLSPQSQPPADKDFGSREVVPGMSTPTHEPANVEIFFDAANVTEISMPSSSTAHIESEM